jgi:hypothetical protein
MLAGLLFEGNDIREIRGGCSGHRALHEFEPDGQRGARAGFFFPE